MTNLKRAQRLGPWRRVSTGIDEAALQGLADDFPNFTEVTELVRKHLTLCQLTPNAPFRLPPLLISGPAGSGKSAFSQRLAKVLGVPITSLDVATMDTSFKVTGLDSGYATGRPGLVWDALQNACISPVVHLEEIDKPPRATHDDGLDCLLSLLEPVSAKTYRDACIRLPMDASHIYWIATCNNPEAISAPQLSRFRLMHIQAPNADQIRAVVESIYRDLRANEAWGMHFPSKLPEEVTDALSMRTPPGNPPGLGGRLCECRFEWPPAPLAGRSAGARR